MTPEEELARFIEWQKIKVRDKLLTGGTPYFEARKKHYPEYYEKTVEEEKEKDSDV